MKDLEYILDVLTTSTAITTAAVSIPTVAEYPRSQRDGAVTRVKNLPPRVHNSPRPVPELVVEYPQATKNSTPT